MKSKKLQFAVAFSVLQAWTVTSGIASAANEVQRARDLAVDDIKSVLLDAALTLDGDVDSYPRTATLDGLVFEECVTRFKIETITKKDGTSCLGFKVRDLGTGAEGEADAVTCSLNALEKFRKDPNSPGPVLLSDLAKEKKVVNSFKVDEEFTGRIAILTKNPEKREGECTDFDKSVNHIAKSTHEANVLAKEEAAKKEKLAKFKKDIVTCNKSEAVLQDTKDQLDELIADGILSDETEEQQKMITDAQEIFILAEKDLKKREIAKALEKAKTPEALVALREKLAAEASADSLADEDLGEAPLLSGDEWTDAFLKVAAKQKDLGEDPSAANDTLAMLTNKSNPLGIAGMSKDKRNEVENERLATIIDYSTQAGMMYGTKSSLFSSTYGKTLNSLTLDWQKAKMQQQRYCGATFNQRTVAKCNEASKTLGPLEMNLQKLSALPQSIEKNRFEMQKQLADMRASISGTNNNNGTILNQNNNSVGNQLFNNRNSSGLIDPATLYQQNNSSAVDPRLTAPGQFSTYNFNGVVG